jgi:hypothetical protein
MSTDKRTMTADLFGHTIDSAPLLVRLDRRCDRARPCCKNLADIRPGRPPHAAEAALQHLQQTSRLVAKSSSRVPPINGSAVWCAG